MIKSRKTMNGPNSSTPMVFSATLSRLCDCWALWTKQPSFEIIWGSHVARKEPWHNQKHHQQAANFKFAWMIWWFVGASLRWSSCFNIVQVPCNQRWYALNAKKNGAVFAFRFDPHGTFSFVPLGTPAGAALGGGVPGDGLGDIRWYTCHQSSPWNHDFHRPMDFGAAAACASAALFRAWNTEWNPEIITFPVWKHIHQRG